MHKNSVETRANHPQEERLLARVLAEDLRQVRGREMGRPYVESVVTGETRKDWSDPEFEGIPSV